MEENHDNHSIHSMGVHLIWCTKYRHKILINEVEVELRKIIGEICRTYDWKLRAIEIMPDHVHLFVQYNYQTSAVDIVKTLKSISAVYIFTKFTKLKGQKFWGSGLWSGGCYYASVGHISEQSVKKYIETQK